MGNSQPKNHAGRSVLRKKLENSEKTKILSLSEHKLDVIPREVFQIAMLKTLDVSKNQLKTIGPSLAVLVDLKILNVDDNLLEPGSLDPVSKLPKLQTLTASGNKLGLPRPLDPRNPNQPQPLLPLPTLPESLKQLKLDNNSFSYVPRQIIAPTLIKLELLSLANNNLASVPEEISNLVSLSELNLDRNAIVALPESTGKLSKLKTLSLRNNAINSTGNFSDKNPQPLPPGLFSDTQLIDLNLHGNPISSTALNEFAGFDKFLERREKVKSKDIYGGALTDLDVCGLK